MSQAYSIGIIAFNDVLTAEVIGPAEVFGIAATKDWFNGTKVLLIGVEPQPSITTQEGVRLLVDATIADSPALDILLVPGGNDVSHLLQHAGLNAFIKKKSESAQWVGSMCAGAFILGNAGVLDGVQATTWFGGESSLQAQFPAINVVHDRPVVLDKRRITANGGVVSYQAALVLLGQLAGTNRAREVYNKLGLGRLEPWEQIEAAILSS